jgi:hypothetical protein
MTQQAHHPEYRRPDQVSLWEPAPRREPAPEPPPVQPAQRKPPWYRRAWFVGLAVVAVSAAAGALVGSQLP